MFKNVKDQIACVTFTMQKNLMPVLAAIGDKWQAYHSFQSEEGMDK